MMQYLLFDLGRVVVDWHPRYLYDKLIPDVARREFFLNEVCTMSWHVAHDKGVSFADNAKALIAQYPEFESEIKAWHERWPEQFSGYIEQMDNLLTRLRQVDGIRLFGLSNVSAEVWDFMLEAFPAINLLEDVIVSGREGLIKPDLRIYARAWDMMGNPPKQDIFFIDDSFANIEAAQSFGFQAHHFKNQQQLTKALGQLPALHGISL